MDKRSSGGVRDPAHADAPLQPAAVAASPHVRGSASQPPASWIAQALIGPARAKLCLIYIASSERRADEIGRALRAFAADLEVLVLPPWDCLPYDRASPSRECMGRRMAVLARLTEPASGPRVLVTSAEALMQRTPPRRVFKQAFMEIAVSRPLKRDRLEAFAAATGYVNDERIDEPGEIVLHGEVADIFPAGGETPIRVSFGEGEVVTEIKLYDPLTQRSEETIEAVRLGPASEVILSSKDKLEREPGVEHRAPEIYGRMETALKLAAEAAVAEDPLARSRARDFADQVREAFEARRTLADRGASSAAAPDRLYIDSETLAAELDRRDAVKLCGSGVQPLPKFALDRNPGRAFANFIADGLAAGRRVVLTGLPHELRSLSRAVARGLALTPDQILAWDEATTAKPGALLALTADADTGFDDPAGQLLLIAAADVLSGRAAAGASQGAPAVLSDPDLRVGDLVLHEDHGLGRLQALERIEVGDRALDALRIEYHGGSSVLAPIEEFGRIWRYGGDSDGAPLDRLGADAWEKRRVALSREIEQTAQHLVALAGERARSRGLVLEPPRDAYVRFAAGFPYPETPDQSAAIQAVLDDMSSGRVMNRLICGDVGFGKTEVALRAAAAAALCGRQVAVVAPTTVLARQHFETFRRRFAGTGVEVGHLSRLTKGGEAKTVKQALAGGSLSVVVGTHALAAADVAFADLGLLIIDEEQRFGAKLKAQLADLAPGAHRLTMTATPIPRTLQLAMVGVEDVSVIATPPARRRPIRTFLAPYDAAVIRTALMREQRRGGQSFVVVPRIEDIDPCAAELQRLAPELSLRIAHGDLPAEEVDEAMVGVAGGDGDVLLATNIIESGLDVPRANTMLVWRAELFGLAQLHQLRGRVGRGRSQGIAYLLTDPEADLSEAALARLNTLVAFDRLGSGLAISARDLDIRGAGDLIGEEQAGHLKLIGTALYQRLLSRAVRAAKEETGPDLTPELNLGGAGSIPERYVPDPTVRINLYARLARLVEVDEVEGFAEELEDRFGAPPPETERLVVEARLQALARAAGVARIDAGPKAIALTLLPGAAPPSIDGLEAADGRLLLRRPAEDGADRSGEIEALLRKL
jgi:transcription-repair coupling factor (superfamily II helicase)